jgi:hypothetical protein
MSATGTTSRGRKAKLLAIGTTAALAAALGLAGIAFSAPASAATGANFVATGHDMDLHCTDGSTDECAYLKIVLDTVRNGSTLPILALDHGTQVPTAIGTLSGEPSVTTVDPDDATTFNATKFVNSSGKPLFSAIVVASDSSCGGCDNTTTSITNINARSADFKAFFNGGGGILALAGAADRDTYYNFVPLGGITGVAVTNPFTVTAQGTTLGITSAMANCCATHNSFTIPPSPLVTLETDSAGKAETIAAFNVAIGGGGFTSPATTTAAKTTTPPVATPHAVNAGGPPIRPRGNSSLVLVGAALLASAGAVVAIRRRVPREH